MGYPKRVAVLVRWWLVEVRLYGFKQLYLITMDLRRSFLHFSYFRVNPTKSFSL